MNKEEMTENQTSQALIDLAKKYLAYEKADKYTYQRKMRVLQSIWREEQGYPIGEHTHNEKSRPIGSRLAMSWAKETLANFLTDAIKDVVRAEVMDKNKSKHKVYQSPRIYNNLLSSQPLCFNLFGELQQDLDLATKVINDLHSSNIKEVTAIEFEFSPGRGDERYTGDKSAFDVYIIYKTELGGKGFLGIEVKYYENLLDEPAEYRARYDEVANLMGCFEPDYLDDLKKMPLEQIWRDHLLMGIHKIVDKFDEGFFIYLYPRINEAVDVAIDSYLSKLSNTESILPWTLEEVIEVIGKYTEKEWLAAFVGRYLDFEKIDHRLQL